jgi:hypothetical protein
MSIPPVIVDDLTLTIKNLHFDIVSHPLIIIISILIIISLIINIVYFSILTFNFLKKNKIKKVRNLTDLYESSPMMEDPTKSSYLRL